MSAESGLSTFRDPDGHWSKFNPAELATPQAFRRDPLKVWEWYRLRRANLRTVEPHEGHRVLAAWEARFAAFALVTQNVDGLHHRAGSRRVIELHGRLDVARCTACEAQVQHLEDLGPDPRCDQCEARMRPGVVWFGESLPPGALEAAFAAARACDILLVIGTSGVVQPAASLADLARSSGASVIEINPGVTPISEIADVAIRSGSRDALRAIDQRLRE
jgi:NAD-dependent deacetylase